MDEFEEESFQSEVYDPETKRALCDIFIAQCDFSCSITELLDIIYPDQVNSNGGTSTSSTIFDKLVEIHTGLSIWHTEFITCAGYATFSPNPSAKLFSSLVSMYYQ
jgi:hypothetical protein